jgi:hypothetical protein
LKRRRPEVWPSSRSSERRFLAIAPLGSAARISD